MHGASKKRILGMVICVAIATMASTGSSVVEADQKRKAAALCSALKAGLEISNDQRGLFSRLDYLSSELCTFGRANAQSKSDAFSQPSCDENSGVFNIMLAIVKSNSFSEGDFNACLKDAADKKTELAKVSDPSRVMIEADLMATRGSCANIFRPTQSRGMACEVPTDCNAPLVCGFEREASTKKVCKEPKPSVLDGVQYRKEGAIATCDVNGTVNICERGVICMGLQEGTGRCVRLPAHEDGARCEERINREPCSNPCAECRAKSAEDRERVCLIRAAKGEFCEQDWECQAGLHCSGDKCTQKPAEEICSRADGDVGSSCQENFDCRAFGSICKNSICIATNSGKDGESCMKLYAQATLSDSGIEEFLKDLENPHRAWWPILLAHTQGGKFCASGYCSAKGLCSQVPEFVPNTYHAEQIARMLVYNQLR